MKSSDSEFLSDDLSPPLKHKMVAIDTSQNKQFSQKLLPVQSPEFDNVMDQVSDTKCNCEMFDGEITDYRLGLIGKNFQQKV